MPGIVKIGATRKHPIERTNELSAATGVPSEFSLGYYQSYSDCFLAESLIHEHFATRRINEGREFFEMHIDEIIDFMQGISNMNEYRKSMCDAPEVQNISGGTHRYDEIKTPWAELFATFPDDGSTRSLTEEEQAKCQALSKRLYGTN